MEFYSKRWREEKNHQNQQEFTYAERNWQIDKLNKEVFKLWRKNLRNTQTNILLYWHEMFK